MLFQNLRIHHAFAHHNSNTKMNFSKRFPKFSSDKKTLCNNNNQTWFSDTLTSARPLGVVKTLAFQARVSTPPLGVQQVLMHRKTCLIPMMKTNILEASCSGFTLFPSLLHVNKIKIEEECRKLRYSASLL